MFIVMCIRAYQGNHLSSSHIEQMFILKGYSNRENEIENFRCHKGRCGPKDAVLKTLTLPHTIPKVLVRASPELTLKKRRREGRVS